MQLIRKSALADSQVSRLSRSPRALDSDNSLKDAKFLGIVKPSSSSTTFQYQSSVGGGDKVDYLRLDIAPGASVSEQVDIVRIKGGTIKATTFVLVPGQSLQKIATFKYEPGKTVEKEEVNLVNPFSEPIEFYLKISAGKNKVKYKAKTIFKP